MLQAAFEDPLQTASQFYVPANTPETELLATLFRVLSIVVGDSPYDRFSRQKNHQISMNLTTFA